MPELPEVQTVINNLKKQKIIDLKITDVKIFKNKILKNSTFSEFKKFIVNEKIIDFQRIGKYIVICLTNKKYLVIHLRMEGKLFILKENEIKKRHLMIYLKLNNNLNLCYYDSRMFGTFHIFNEQEFKNNRMINKIAIDPLNEKFNYKFLKEKIKSSKKPIKSVLLDQEIVSGIGNIYANEILFCAKINPLKKANTLTDKNFKDIVLCSKKILTKAVKMNGTTIFSFKFDKNHSGGYQDYLKVHGKKICSICKKPIEKIKINSRGTYFCKQCQKQ